ncbi:hypothetical protein JCM9743_19060 [Natrinema sp. JCM 9743]
MIMYEIVIAVIIAVLVASAMKYGYTNYALALSTIALVTAAVFEYWRGRLITAAFYSTAAISCAYLLLYSNR